MVCTQAGTCPPGAQSTGSSGATVMGVLANRSHAGSAWLVF